MKKENKSFLINVDSGANMKIENEFPGTSKSMVEVNKSNNRYSKASTIKQTPANPLHQMADQEMENADYHDSIDLNKSKQSIVNIGAAGTLNNLSENTYNNYLVTGASKFK